MLIGDKMKIYVFKDKDGNTFWYYPSKYTSVMYELYINNMPIEYIYGIR